MLEKLTAEFTDAVCVSFTATAAVFNWCVILINNGRGVRRFDNVQAPAFPLNGPSNLNFPVPINIGSRTEDQARNTPFVREILLFCLEFVRDSSISSLLCRRYIAAWGRHTLSGYGKRAEGPALSWVVLVVTNFARCIATRRLRRYIS